VAGVMSELRPELLSKCLEWSLHAAVEVLFLLRRALVFSLPVCDG